MNVRVNGKSENHFPHASGNYVKARFPFNRPGWDLILDFLNPQQQPRVYITHTHICLLRAVALCVIYRYQSRVSRCVPLIITLRVPTIKFTYTEIFPITNFGD